MKFQCLCASRTESMCELLNTDHELYASLLDFMVTTYIELSLKEHLVERIENSSIISLFIESIDCLDGIDILHQQGSVNSAYPLLRKLMELNFQIKFMLKDDTPNKALAFEAYYVSRKMKGNDDERNIYRKYAKYNAYKTEADRVFKEERYNKFPNWYEIYDFVEKKSESTSQRKNLLNSLKKLCEAVGDKEIYDTIYNLISKNVHGFFARDHIKLDPSTNINYLENYRYPVGITFQSKCSYLMAYDICKTICCYYSIPVNYCFFEEKSELMKQIELKEKQYIN